MMAKESAGLNKPIGISIKGEYTRNGPPRQERRAGVITRQSKNLNTE